jgi:hypothetical protein
MAQIHYILPSEVAQLVGIFPRTARRYYADWRKTPVKFSERYSLAKTQIRNGTEFSKGIIELL